MTWPTRYAPSPYHRLLWSAVFSRLAGSAELVIINFWVLHATGSAVALGAVTAARLLPLVVSAPLGGALADRFNPLRLLSAMCAISAAFTAALAAGIGAGWGLEALCAVLAARGFVTAAEPAMRQIAVARMAAAGGARQAATVRGMADLSTLTTLCLVLGPLLSGALLASVGTGWGIGVLAVLQAAAAALTVARTDSESGAAAGSSSGAAAGRQVRGATRGLAALAGDRQLAAQVILALGPMLTVFPYTSMIPVMAAAVAGSSATAAAAASAAAACGAVATTFVLRRRAGRMRDVGKTAVRAAACASVPLAAGAVALAGESGAWLVFALVVLGAVGQLYRTANRAAVALRAPEGAQGAVLGISAMDRVLIPLGSMALGVVASVWDASAMLGCMAAANLVLLLPALALRRG
ncbi:MFS transporter [Corynebacterium liangguodongii]|uniref:MFS transporter n=1 Tax=Corynebacterium liangguodongii TaxID=2079535 RepID=A0A2S0WF94_9CORY|nr:MFS transporter [Corynebacterium liangguodongii]AWB84426.1 MFS transporter [Corynebacterium liangguodongii]PWB99916.1 MFS transporter [Corynebacterium liangguodongii]